MDLLKRLLSAPRSSDTSSFGLEAPDKFLRVKGWLSSLSPSDRSQFSEKYLVPVFGEQAAAWVKQQLEAERAEVQITLDSKLAQLRTTYAEEIQPLILSHIKDTFKRIDKEARKTSFDEPILNSLWKVAVARTGLDVIAAGQTTYEEMLRDFDKLIEVLVRMSHTFDRDKEEPSTSD